MTEKQANKLGYFIVKVPMGFGLKKVKDGKTYYSGNTMGWAEEKVKDIPHIPLKEAFINETDALDRVHHEVHFLNKQPKK